MIRVVKGYPESSSTERTYADPIPVVDQKRWTTDSVSSTLREIDCDNINFIDALELFRPWERLKLPLLCSVCGDRKSTSPLLDRVHWIYLQCTQCPEFFVCGECLASDNFADHHDPDHDYVLLQTRPLASPTPNGSELGQLLLFKGVQTADDFFLYFPWFFHCFEGMDEYTVDHRAVMMKDMIRVIVSADQGTANFMVNCLSFPPDWYLRCFGGGNWRMLHQSLEPTVDARIQIARASSMLDNLLTTLRGFLGTKNSVYGSGDIPANMPPEHEATVAQFAGDGGHQYLRYIHPLHFLTILDKDICRKKIRDALYSGTSSTESDTPQGSVASAGNWTLVEGTSQMLHWGGEMSRLWQMFRVLFEDDPGFKNLVPRRVASNITGPDLSYMKPTWQKFLIRDYTIRAKLLGVGYDNLPDVQYLHLLPAAPGPGRAELEVCRRERVLGNFEEAALKLQEMDLSDSDVLVELQLVYLQQGYLNKAINCGGLLGNIPVELMLEQLSRLSIDLDAAPHLPESPSLCLLKITSKYAACFVHGAWELALDVAEQAFRTYCATDVLTLPEEAGLITVRIELMYHRVILETYRDLGQWLPAERPAERLDSIFKKLHTSNPNPVLAELAWETLLLELEMRKRPVKDHYFEAESSFNLTKFVSTPAVATPLLKEFLSSTVLSGEDQVSELLRGRAEFILADLYLENGAVGEAQIWAARARKRLMGVSCVVDLLDLDIIDATIGTTPTFAEIGPIYQQLRSRNDLRRMKHVRRIGVQCNEAGPGVEWQMYQREALQDIAREAGDNITAQRWSLRKYAGDYQVAASVLPAEAVLDGDTVQSTLLTTLASFNLSKAHTTLGNHFSAALSAMLHLSLVNATVDTEAHQRAILEVLRVFTSMVVANPVAHAEKLPRLTRYWNGWLDDRTISRWNLGGVRCDEIDWFIDGACFLPLLSGKISRWQNGKEILDHDTEFEASLIEHLCLAFDLYDAAPTYLASAIIPKLALALGATAAYIGNAELAIKCYWLGICSCHSEDNYTIALLRLESGKQMTLLAERDPENWLHVVAPGRSLLHAATGSFRLMSALSGTLLNQAEANLYLSASYVAEARARKEALAEIAISETREEGGYAEALEALIAVTVKAQAPLRSNSLVFDTIAMNLELGAVDRFTEDLARLAENPFLCETRQLSLDLALLNRVFDIIRKRQYGQGFWDVVQRSKGTVLGYHYGRLVPSRVLKTIQSSPQAWRLYVEEARLIKQGPQYRTDNRLFIHQATMAKHEELRPLLDRRSGRGVSMPALSVLVNEVVRTTRDVIMLDWIQFRDIFVLTGYNARTGTLSCFDMITLPVTDVENWVRETLRVDDRDISDTLGAYDKLKPLWPLTADIHRTCRPGDILVFCPSKILNSIPLHAIPYRNENDQPIIHYHPIVYAPNNTVLKECVERALHDTEQSSLASRGSFFCRYPENQDMANTAISQMQSILDRNGVPTVVTSGAAVTQTALRDQFNDADILHLHGHTAGRELERHLVLEAEAEAFPDHLPSNDTSTVQYTARVGITPFLSLSEIQRAQQVRTQRFTLQDSFTLTVRARLVMLMGCGSGIQVTREGDDALGLVNAFLAAGATSVMATLWPLDSTDAAEFSKRFYENMFKPPGQSEPDSVINLAVAFQKSVNLMRACTETRCAGKSLNARLRCHGVAPYHWAPFTLSGSWVCRSFMRTGAE